VVTAKSVSMTTLQSIPATSLFTPTDDHGIAACARVHGFRHVRVMAAEMIGEIYRQERSTERF
jgi:hypothetical protein